MTKKNGHLAHISVRWHTLILPQCGFLCSLVSVSMPGALWDGAPAVTCAWDIGICTNLQTFLVVGIYMYFSKMQSHLRFNACINFKFAIKF